MISIPAIIWAPVLMITAPAVATYLRTKNGSWKNVWNKYTGF